jgi:SAM-dependent methyltransferase
MAISENHVCPVCNSTNNSKRHLHKTQYIVCQNCALSWRFPPVTLDETTDFYKTTNPTDAVNNSKNDLHISMLLEAENRLGKPGRLLDVGCGGGHFLEVAKNRGWEVTGIEPVEPLVEIAKKNGLNVFPGTIDTNSENLGKYDLITYWDVMVLVEDLINEMKTSLKYLENSGLIYWRVRHHMMMIVVDYIWTYGARILGIKNPTVYHPFNYEPKTVKVVARRLGLKSDVTGGKLTAGDPYSVGSGSSLITLFKQAVETISTGLENFSNGRLIISPTIDAWFFHKNK